MTLPVTSTESRAEEVARVRSYITSQAARRTPAQLVEALKEAHQQFVQATMAVPEPLFVTSPQPGEWSAAQVLTHVLDIAAFDVNTIAALLESGKQGAEYNAMQSTYQVTSRQEGLDELDTLRSKLIEAALAADPESYPDVVWTHPEFGPLHWREGLLFARVHSLDHAKQMASIAATFANNTAEGGQSCKIAVSLNTAKGDWEAGVEYAQQAEKLGIDSIWAAEMWGYDGATPLAYLAAKTSTIKLGTGIMQAGSRTPTMVAMTAMSFYSLSGGRFKLGLGVSGPQVIQGWYGADFDQPYQRLKEHVAIIRMITRGERLDFKGKIYQVPLPTTESKALKSWATPCPNLPIYLATLGPKNLELTGEIADGWLGTSFIPEKADVYLEPIAAGAKRAGRTITALDIQVSAGVVAFGDDLEALVAPRKPGLAFTLGAMGSREHNYYNQVYQRAGYADIALEVQDLWLKGQREEAARVVPDELVLKTNLLGTEAMILERLRLYQTVGVTTIAVEPSGETMAARLATLSRLLNLVNQL